MCFANFGVANYGVLSAISSVVCRVAEGAGVGWCWVRCWFWFQFWVLGGGVSGIGIGGGSSSGGGNRVNGVEESKYRSLVQLWSF